MSIELSVRQVSGITIFDLSGRMEAGIEGQTLHAALIHAFENGHRWLVLNCAELKSIDSAGLGDMVAAHSAILRRGGVLRLLHPTRRLAELLAVTRIDCLVDVYHDEAAALRSFNAMSNQREQMKFAAYMQQDD